MTQVAITAEELEQFSGTMDYHRHPFGGYYTDGVAFLAERAGAYWLVDAIFSWLHKTKCEEFQVWLLERGKGDSAMLVGEDGNGKVIGRQRIGYTDFPLASVKLYLERGSVDGVTPAWVLMLPGER
jgi:hypothetical protein